MKTASIARILTFFSVVLLTATGLRGTAQTTPTRHGTLTGKLLDASTHEPIPNAHVVLLRTTDQGLVSTATTRADGSFVIYRVPFGKYSFRTTVLGYRPTYPLVALTAQKSAVALGDVTLQPLGTQLARVPAAPAAAWVAVAR